MPATITLDHWEDAPLTIIGRVEGLDGDAIVQADLASIALKVFNNSTKEQIGVTTALTVSDVIFDTLQTDYGWSADSEGYNFRYTMAATFFPTGGQVVLVEVIGTATSGGAVPIWHGKVNVVGLESS